MVLLFQLNIDSELLVQPPLHLRLRLAEASEY